jgi:DNA-binding transcriptional MerR regulator
LSNIQPTVTIAARKKCMSKEITIGLLAKNAGCKVQTIRYYEQIGILPEPRRSAGNQRIYSRDHIDRLLFVRHSRELGFSLDQIRKLLQLASDESQPCDDVDKIAKDHLAAVEEKIMRLEGLRMELKRIINCCDEEQINSCKILRALGDHGQCLSSDHG